jgi:hypothetical protein
VRGGVKTNHDLGSCTRWNRRSARNSSPLRNGFVFQFCKLTTFCSEVSFNLGGKLPHRKGDSALLM